MPVIEKALGQTIKSDTDFTAGVDQHNKIALNRLAPAHLPDAPDFTCEYTDKDGNPASFTIEVKVSTTIKQAKSFHDADFVIILKYQNKSAIKDVCLKMKPLDKFGQKAVPENEYVFINKNGKISTTARTIASLNCPMVKRQTGVAQFIAASDSFSENNPASD